MKKYKLPKKILHISFRLPKYWGKQIFTHGSLPEVGQKQKTVKKMVITMGKLGRFPEVGEKQKTEEKEKKSW